MAAKRGMNTMPGFNPHVFAFGQHVGSQPDLGGIDPQELMGSDLWNQPFQDPYQAGPNTPPMMGMQQPQMGGMMPPQMGMPMGGEPQQPQGGGHPGWAGVGDYLSSDSFKDSLLGGIIAGQMATNPQGALQMALQWRQHKDQRRFQAEQNQLQRDAMMERAKLAQDNKKEEDQQRKVFGQLHLAQSKAAQLGVSIPEWEANTNQVFGPDTVDTFLAHMSAVEQERKTTKALDDKKTKDFQQQVKVAGDIAKGTLVGKTPWDGDPGWDAIKAGAEVIGRSRREFNSNMQKNRQEISQLTGKLKTLDLQQKPAEGQTKSPKYKQALVELAEANKQYDATQNDIDALTKGSKTPLGDIDYSKEIADKQVQLEAAQTRVQESLDKARTLASGKDIDLMPPPVVKTHPSDKAKKGFAIAIKGATDEKVRQQLLASWAEQYDEAPPTSP